MPSDLLDYEHQPAIEYALHDGVKLHGDLYVPKTRGKYPVLIAIHGGGWKMGELGRYRHWGPYLAARGLALFTIDYRLVAPGRKAFPEAVHDVRAAVQFVRSGGASSSLDAERIGLMGDSAGAHLAALAALAGDTPPLRAGYPGDPHASSSTRVKVVVGIYGVYDMAAQWEYDRLHRPLDPITENFVGASLIENRRLFFDASPLSYATVENNKTAFLLAWGTEDDIVDRGTQSEAFLRALKQAGFFARSVILTGAPHFWMWDPIDEPASWTGFLAPRLVRFLEGNL